jgi:putative hydrolase of the HAD superfamily
MSMQIKHVFFDLDHTLWDFETNSDKTFALIFERNKVALDLMTFTETYRPINRKYWKLFREDKVSKSDLRYLRLREAFDALEFEAGDELIHTLSEEYIAFLSLNNALFANALEVLDYLRGKYRLHIITNGFEEVQHRKLDNSRLRPYFEQVITSEKAGVKKPDPGIFLHALEQAGARSEESIMIGDNFEADILGARNVGMQAIFCEFNGEVATEEVPTIRELIELKSML